MNLDNLSRVCDSDGSEYLSRIKDLSIDLGECEKMIKETLENHSKSGSTEFSVNNTEFQIFVSYNEIDWVIRVGGDIRGILAQGMGRPEKDISLKKPAQILKALIERGEDISSIVEVDFNESGKDQILTFNELISFLCQDSSVEVRYKNMNKKKLKTLLLDLQSDMKEFGDSRELQSIEKDGKSFIQFKS